MYCPCFQCMKGIRMREYLNVMKALGDENRLRIVMMLKVRPLCVCEMHEVLNIALSTISAHLKLMKNIGILDDEKDGRWVTYRLVKENSFVNELLEVLGKGLRNNQRIQNDRRMLSRITREICAARLKKSNV